MLIFYKIAIISGRNKGNYLNSIIINLFYLILIIPGLYLSKDLNFKQILVFHLIDYLLDNLFETLSFN